MWMPYQLFHLAFFTFVGDLLVSCPCFTELIHSILHSLSEAQGCSAVPTEASPCHGMWVCRRCPCHTAQAQLGPSQTFWSSWAATWMQSLTDSVVFFCIFCAASLPLCSSNSLGSSYGVALLVVAVLSGIPSLRQLDLASNQPLDEQGSDLRERGFVLFFRPFWNPTKQHRIQDHKDLESVVNLKVFRRSDLVEATRFLGKIWEWNIHSVLCLRQSAMSWSGPLEIQGQVEQIRRRL